MQPLIVTLALPDGVQRDLDELRTRYFPPNRTQVGTHLTLFHALPGHLEALARSALTDAMPAEGIEVRFSRVMSLGRGVALAAESHELVRRHRVLQHLWNSDLTAQDRQPLRPHVTVQNKVDDATARETAATLAAGFAPVTVTATGFDLWRYDGGPWTHLARLP